MSFNIFSWQDTNFGTLACSNGHIILANLKHEKDAIDNFIAEVRNEAEALPLTLLQAEQALAAKGFTRIEWGPHTAMTDPVPAEPVVKEPGEPVGGIVESKPEAPAPVVATDAPKTDRNDSKKTDPAPNVKGSEPVPWTMESLQALGEDELKAVALAEGVNIENLSTDDIILTILQAHEEKDKK